VALTADHLIIIGNGRLICDASLDSFVRQSGRADVLVRSADDGTLTRILAKAGAVAIPEPANAHRVSQLADLGVPAAGLTAHQDDIASRRAPACRPRPALQRTLRRRLY
jgi:hypothetical protein